MTCELRILILGAQRSGTSLLSRMLNQHPEIGVPQESHVYNHFYDIRYLYGDLALRRNQRLLLKDIVSFGDVRLWSPALDIEDVDRNISGSGFGAVVDAMMRSWASKQGKSSWGEKTPSHIDFVDPILGHFRDIKVVHIVRDPRDVCLSMIRARFGPKNHFAAAIAWSKYLSKVRDLKERYAKTKIIEVRYEELLASPETVLKDLCTRLGVEYVDAMLQFYDDEHPYNTDKTNLENLRRTLMIDNTGKWRREFSERAIATIECIAEVSMTEYGYSLSAERLPEISAVRRVLYQLDNRLKRIVSMIRNRRAYGEAIRWLRLRVGLLIRSRAKNTVDILHE
jgi:hypothetical protein